MFDAFLINCIWDWFVEYSGFAEPLVSFKVNCSDVTVVNDWSRMHMTLSVTNTYTKKPNENSTNSKNNQYFKKISFSTIYI